MTSYLTGHRAWETILLLVLLSALALLALFAAPGATAQPIPGEIRGTVTGANGGLPINGATIQAYDVDGNTYGLPAVSDVNGEYSLPDLEAGDYRLLFTANDGIHTYIFYQNQTSLTEATPVPVPENTVVENIDQEIPAGTAGDIHGRVTAEDTGDPLAGVVVQAFDADDMPAGNPAVSNSSGEYLVSGLPAGDYRLLFTANDGIHASIYYHDVHSLDMATPVAVPAGGAVFGIDQALPLGGSVTGTVRGADDGRPLPDVAMDLYCITWHNHRRTDIRVIRDPSVKTDVNGVYTFSGLPTGQYVVQAMPRDFIHYEEWWYGGKSSQEEAVPFTVRIGAQTTGIDLDVPAGGAISGKVVDSTDTELEDVRCTAYRYDPRSKTWQPVLSTGTIPTGQYIIGPVEPGTYKVEFSPNEKTHIGEWYNNKADEKDADKITVHRSQITSGINAVLTRTVKISGKVVSNDPDAYPIPEVTVKAYLKVGNKWSLRYSEQTSFYKKPEGGPPGGKPQGGEYFIEGMVPGTYIVQFVPPRNIWKDQYYKGKAGQSTADRIVLAEGAAAANVNAALAWDPDNIEWYGVTPAESSDFGSLLSSVGFGYNNLSLGRSYDLVNLSLLKRFKWIFINCSGDFHDGYRAKVLELFDNLADAPLVKYVNSGGKVFVSDHGGPPLFRGLGLPFNFYQDSLDYEHGRKQSVTASVVDPKMRAGIGSSTVPMTYDREGHTTLTGVPPEATVNMRATIQTNLKDTLANVPVCATLPFGSGKVVYQTFHLDKQSPEYAKKMLFYFLERKPAPPKIDSISPALGPVKTVVTIKGSNFGSSRPSTSWVTFNNKKVTSYLAWSSKEIRVAVPVGATTGPVWVTTGAGTSNRVTFSVTQAPEGAAWYLAEGCTDFGFETFINIENPNGVPVTASVQYMTPEGPFPKRDVSLPAYSQTTLNPREVIGAKDFSTQVICTSGAQIAVDRRMVWTGPGAASQEGHSSVGVVAPANKWYLAEGSSKWGFECWLLAQNPNKLAANLTVTYMIEGEGPVTKTRSVPAGGRQSWSMADDIGAKDASVTIESDSAQVPIIVERAMYRNNRREGHGSVGTPSASKTFYLAEGTTGYGFTTYVLVQNPNPGPATVTLSYMTKSGARPQPAMTLPANSRKTVRVNDVAGMQDQDFSTKVTGSLPIIAERAMYWGEGTPLGEACHASVGMQEAHSAFYLPDGETSGGYETWTCVQNPNPDPVKIEVVYFESGGTKRVTPMPDTVPGNSRKTYNMADKIPSGKAAILVRAVTPGVRIMVERSMYWNSRGAGTNTIGGFSDR